MSDLLLRLRDELLALIRFPLKRPCTVERTPHGVRLIPLSWSETVALDGPLRSHIRVYQDGFLRVDFADGVDPSGEAYDELIRSVELLRDAAFASGQGAS